jgi:hypothetical protein
MQLAHERGTARAGRANERPLLAQRLEARAARSKSAWFDSQARPGGGGASSRSSARTSTRRTFTSTVVSWASNAKHAIALAV